MTVLGHFHIKRKSVKNKKRQLKGQEGQKYMKLI